MAYKIPHSLHRVMHKESPAYAPLVRFADNLSRVLGMHRLSHAQASVLLGVSANSFSSWMTGRREPNRDALLNVARWFELPVETLYRGSAVEVVTLSAEPERFARIEAKIGREPPPVESA